MQKYRLSRYGAKDFQAEDKINFMSFGPRKKDTSLPNIVYTSGNVKHWATH